MRQIFKEEFSGKPPVAFFRSRFGAEKSYSALKFGEFKDLRDVPISHELKERSLVLKPVFRTAVSLSNFWT